MKAPDVIKQLRALGDPSYKRIIMRHGAREPVLGVKISELKKFQQRIKIDYELARELFSSGIYDAQYLAGLIADDSRMTKTDLKQWLAQSNGSAIAGTTVAWVAAESKHGEALALQWIDAKDEKAAQAGWMTLAGRLSIVDDAELDLANLKRLLKRVVRTIHDEANLVRYAMNGFVISLGCYVAPLTDAALEAADAIGTVTVDMGDTACKTPPARQYIEKAKQRGSIGKKRKTVKC